MFAFFKDYSKLFKFDEVCIDNHIFRLHYKVTVILLIIFAVQVFSTQHVGNPIECLADQANIPNKMLETWCWLHSTYTIPARMATDLVDVNVVAPGVGPARPGDPIKYHNYYPWVCYILAIQALLFYLPRLFWSSWEGGKMKMLTLDLHSPVTPHETKTERRQLQVNFFCSYWNRNNVYALRLFFCEVLNLVNAFCQVYLLLDVFFDNEFEGYGPRVLDSWAKRAMGMDEGLVDPMDLMFPKVTKCNYHKFGPSGTLERIDAICLMPLNRFNEKIFFFLWFYLWMVVGFSALIVLYRAVLLTPWLGHVVRRFVMQATARMASHHDVAIVAQKWQIGDWYLLLLLASNNDDMVIKDLFRDLAVKLEERDRVDGWQT